MGLDMYLSAKLYMSEYLQKDAHEAMKQVRLPGVTIPGPYLDDNSSFELEVPIMYWRKANHIHGWFVNNVQGGTDDCKPYYVDVDKLRELDKLCAEVVVAGAPTVAMERLPGREGFFFGGTEIDEWYWEQTRETMDALHRLLADTDSGKLAGWEFYYRASW